MAKHVLGGVSLGSLVAAGLSMGLSAEPALAQLGTTAEAETSYGDEIVVTARRRDETSIAVPVILSAVGAEELERRGIVSLDVLSHAIPQVMIGDAAGGVQGGTVAIRGISTGEQNPFADQAVSFNVDGTQIARVSPRRMAQMDIAQLEVLKGPQALFFGKNSPGGIISIRTADPTPNFEAKASVGYEVNAHEWRGEGYVSGPLADDLGIRIAAFGSTMRGWVKNVTVPHPTRPNPDPGFAPVEDKWNPATEEIAGRITLKYDPSDTFNVRAKASYGYAEETSTVALNERFFCPTGSAQTGDIDDCKRNHRSVRGDVGPFIAQTLQEEENGGHGTSFRDGVPYGEQQQFLGSVEMNFMPADALTLTSLTSYYWSENRFMDNFTWTANPVGMLASSNHLRIREMSQEVRLASEWESPLNFLIGAHFQDSHLDYNVRSVIRTIPPIQVTRIDALKQDGRAYSAFGQLRFDVNDQLELAAGGRYSYEKKTLRGFRGFFPPAQVYFIPEIEQDVVNPKASWKNFSPEATITWRPTSRLTVFGAYKHGFLSGGFNSGSGNFNVSREFDQTKIKGYEGGVKAQIGDLRTNLGAYNYKLTGLQVSTIVPFPALGTTAQVVTNAGGARVKGVEFDFNWRPNGVPGLSVRGALAYNRARYSEFITTCYPGQTKALGCNLVVSPDGPIPATPAQTATLQDMSGFQLVRAPAWNATVGASYDRPLSSGWKIGLSADAAYTSSYWGSATSGAGTRESGYWLLDATARFYSDDNGLEFAVIGRNLTDELYVTRSLEVPFSGLGAGTDRPDARFGDVYGNVARGREVMFRVSKKF